MNGCISTFEVIIWNPNGVCEPGQKLTGEVIVENCTDVKFKEIRLECAGLAHVHWIDTRNADGCVEPESADEQYYKCQQVLYPQSTTDSTTTPAGKCHILNSGSHSFPFEFPIPPKLPCSFEGPFGHVRYWLKAIIEKQWTQKVNIRPFTINPKLDLNNLPHCNDEVFTSKSFQLSSFLSSSGSCFASLSLPRKGFILGEKVPVEIHIKNDSDNTLRLSTLTLAMILHYETANQSRNSKIYLSKLSLGKVLAGTTLNRSENRLSIPNNLPPNLNGCGIINVRYAIILSIKPSYLSFKALKLPVEIIIGTIPLRSDSHISTLDSTTTPAGKCHILNSGSHSFPFEFPIPPKLPCSFEGPFGHVRYWLKAIIEKQWTQKVNIRPFTINPKLDLNNLPHCNDEVFTSKSFQLSSFLSSSGSCFASLSLPRKGFILGEKVPVEIHIKNDSDNTLRLSTLTLAMILHYETANQSRNSKIYLSKLSLGKVLAGTTLNRSENRLSIPNNLPPNLNGCGIINVRYAIILSIKPSYLSFKALKLPVEIIIGTIPLRSDSHISTLADAPPTYREVMDQESDLPSYQEIRTH